MRVRWPVIALMLAVGVAVFAGCGDDETTTTPTAALTAQITAAPASPTTGSVVDLTVTANPVGTYAVRWTADSGTFDDASSATTKWTAPDQDGTYLISVVIGDGEKSATAKKSMVVATYTPGTDPHYLGAQTCNGCHNHQDTYTVWSASAHAGALAGLQAEGMGTNPVCLGCHTVGFNGNVANGGYDEQAVPRLAGVQCENCHGPASDHVGGGGTNVSVNTSAGLCGSCHNGEHHPTMDEWTASGHHKVLSEEGGEIPGKESGCAKCHNGTFSMEYLDDTANFTNPTVEEAEAADTLSVACAVCHDPHGNGNPSQLRNASVNPVKLPDGVTTPEIGKGKLCIACHQGRRGPSSIQGQINNGTAHFGPHHAVQGDMLAGVDAVTDVNPGFVFRNDAHLRNTDGCVSCHMHKEGYYTGHEFGPKVEACAPCHGSITNFTDIMARGDYDGDGTIEGLQTEVEGLLGELATTIIANSRDVDRQAQIQAAYDGGTFSSAIGDTSISSIDQRKAGYNYFYVEYDQSKGVHNPIFAVELLQQSILFLNRNALAQAKILTD